MTVVLDPALLEPLKAHWMTGGPARSAAPSEWAGRLDGLGESEAELFLLTLAGQATKIALLPQAPQKLSIPPRLPALSLPSLESDLRPAFRRLIATEKSGEQITGLIALITTRGRASHPFDWMPSAHHEGLPEVYAPWIDWAAGAGTKDPEGELDEESWEEFTPARRSAALRVLRQRDRAAAGELMRKHLAGEDAATRLAHLTVIESDLGEDDLPLLESFQNDRSQKVKAFVSICCARLGQSEPDPGAMAALNDFFRIAGLLAKRRIEPIPIKTRAKIARRTELLDSLPLSAFAEAFGWKSENIVSSWRFGVDEGADAAVARMIAQSAPVSLIETFIARAGEKKYFEPQTMEPLLPRLTQSSRSELIRSALERSALALPTIASWAHPGLGSQSEDVIRRSAGWKTIEKGVREEKKKEDASHNNRLRSWLFAAGLLATNQAATQLIARLQEIGLDPFDPRLAALQFNASLTPNSPT